MATKTHLVLQVDSRLAVEALPTRNTHSSFTMPLAENLDFLKKDSNLYDYLMKVNTAKFPNTFYQINSNYNTLKGEEEGSPWEVSVPEGNYSLDDLTTLLETLVSAASPNGRTYTFDIDDVKGKILISITGNTSTRFLTIIEGSTLNNSLGLGEDGLTVVGTTATYAPNVANVNNIGYLKILCNITTSNHYNINGRSRVLFTLQLTSDGFDIVPYANNDGDLLELSNVSSIGSIQFEVRDQYDNLVEFNGVANNFQLAFYRYEKIQRVSINYVHSNIWDKLKSFFRF